MSTAARAERFYSRYSNPSVKAFEDAVAALEGAEASLAFASGMGALASVVLALCSPGDHIVAQRQIYSGTQLFLAGVCARFGIERTFVDGTEPGAFAAAVRPGKTMLVIAETPANPQLTVTDLAEVGAIQGPFTLVDSTFGHPSCSSRCPSASTSSALGHEGHRRAQRRHPRRGLGRCRSARRHLELQRAARRVRLARSTP